MPLSEEDLKIKLVNVRLSFPQIWNAVKFNETAEPKFEATYLLDPTNPAHAASLNEIRAKALALANQEWPNGLPPGLGICIKDGNMKAYDGYPGIMFVPTNNKTRPTIVDQNRDPLVEADGKPYAGCIVNATITLWAQNNKWGSKINANLRAIQFVKDGEPFSGNTPAVAEEEFDVVDGQAIPATAAAVAVAPAAVAPAAVDPFAASAAPAVNPFAAV